MKTWYLLPFVMVLGLMVGRWLPKDELRTAKAVKPAEQPAPKNDSFNNLTRMIQIPDRASRPRREPDAPALARGAEEAPPATDATEETPRERRRREWRERQNFSPDDLRARIDEAKELWATRVEIARAQALDKLGLAESGNEASFDAAINTMNESMMLTVQALADELKNGTELTPELGLRVVSEMSAAMVAAYDDLALAVPPEMHGNVSTMQMTDFIDPGVIEPLIDVQDKLQNIRPMGMGGMQ